MLAEVWRNHGRHATHLRVAAMYTLMVSFGLVLVTGASSIVIARGLGPEGRGGFEAILFLPRFLTPVVQFGLSDANTYLVAHEPKLGPRLFAQSLGFALTVGVLAAAATLPFLGLFLAQYSSDVTVLAAIAIFTMPLGIFSTATSGLLRGQRAYGTWNLLRLLQPASELFAVTALSMTGLLNVRTLTAQHILVGGLLLVAVEAYVMRGFLRGGFTIHLPTLRRALAYGSRTQAGTLAEVAGSQIGRLLLIALLAPAQLGVFVVATRVADLLLLVPQASAVFLLSEMPRRSQMSAIHLTWRLLSLNAVILVVAGGALTLSLPFVIVLVYGSAFNGSIVPGQILVAGSACLGLARIITESLKGLGRPLHGAVGYTLGAGAALLLLVLLVPSLGTQGAALASTAGYLVALLTASACLVCLGRTHVAAAAEPTTAVGVR